MRGLLGRGRPVAMACMLLGALAAPCRAAVDASSGLEGKVIVGYQGWFGCPGDFADDRSWVHWFAGDVPDAAHLRVELLPDVSEYPEDALCATDLKRPDGAPIALFSEAKAGAVDLHFRWMARYGIDGAAVQRFIGVASRPATLARWDHELEIERAAAESSGRAFFVAYDITGGDPRTVVADLERDWRHLVDDLRVTASPNYLRDHGKPVLEIWGFGVADRPGDPAEVAGLVAGLKSGAFGPPPATLVGGVPPEWRTLDGSAKTDPAWTKVYRAFDVISPWYTGRSRTPSGAEAYIGTRVAGDLALTKRWGIGFMPVVFPGFSWSNLMRTATGRTVPLNAIPRLCGRFYWTQIRAMLNLHAPTLYVAMFDEVDEGTAVLKTVAKSTGLPAGARLLALDADGCDLPGDAYLRITGAAARWLRSGAPPPAAVEEALPPLR